MKKWLRNKLRVWFGIEELSSSVKLNNGTHRKHDEQIKILSSRNRVLAERLELMVDKTTKTRMKLDSMKSQLDDTSQAMSDVYKTVESVVSVGADVCHESYGSWAVICIEGKMNIVKFVDLDRRSAMEVLDYLRRFPVSRKVNDVPPFLGMDFKW